MNSKIDPIIAVKDVEASSNWYQTVLGCKSMHGGKDFDILVKENNDVLLCLHKWGEHGHPTMMNPEIKAGNGLILYFRTEKMNTIRENAKKINASVVEDIHLNTNSTKMEFSLTDPDGYFLIITEYHEFEG